MAATAPSAATLAASSAPRAAQDGAAAVAAAAAAKADPKEVRLGVSASVGHDHWANDVLSAVHDKAASPAASSDGGGSSGPAVAAPPPPLTAEEAVAARVAEKKRKFHSGRMLELKNLPDGCTEEVRLLVQKAGDTVLLYLYPKY